VKEWVRKLDIVGILILAAVFLADRIMGIWTVWMTVLAVVGGLAILAAIVFRWEEIRAGLGRRSARYGANSVTSIVLLLGVLTLVNYLGSEHSSRWDLTTEKRFSLAEQSRDVLDQLVEDVHIRAFYSGDDQGVEDLLKLYAAASPRISFEFVDPDVQPQLASQYDVTVYGVSGNPLTGESFSFGIVILEMGGRTERIESETEPLSEQDVTNALTKLVKGETKTIYFIEGHGEKQISDTERSGMATARAALERENYRVESLNLVRVEAIPEDAAVLVWPGPEVEPLTGEVDLVDAWLDQGGSLMVMVDPPPDGAGLAGLLGRWSVSAGDDFVVDVSGLGQLFGTGPEVPLVTESEYDPDHPITEGFRVTTLFPMVRSVRAEDAPEEETITELLSTSPQSWSETELGAESVAFDEDSDVRGPIPIGLAITKEIDDDTAARMVVVGDSDFAANGFFGALGNGDLFLNSVSWLAEDEGFISIRPHEPEDRPLTLTQAGATIAYYLTIVLFPLSVLITGVSVWARRRRQ
jgi:gliding motility-associatede transport system auxiliary component